MEYSLVMEYLLVLDISTYSKYDIWLKGCYVVILSEILIYCICINPNKTLYC